MAIKKSAKKAAPAKAAKKAAPAKKAAKKKAPAKPAKAAPKIKKAAPKKAAKVAKAAKPAKAVKPAKPVKAAKPVKEEPKKFVPVPPKKPVLPSPKNEGNKQYTQSEFFEAIRGYCGFATRNQAKDYYEGFSTMLQAALKNGYKLVLPGLGKLQVRKTKPRKGRNPITQETIQIPAKRKIAFTALKALKQAVL